MGSERRVDGELEMWLTENRGEKINDYQPPWKRKNYKLSPQTSPEASPPPTHLQTAGVKGPPCMQSPPANYSFIPAGLVAVVRLALDVLTKLLIWQRAAVVETPDWENCSRREGRIFNADGLADEWASDSDTRIWYELK